MKERGILFSAPMVRAILDGKKTQTRRLYKPAKGFPYEDGEITPTSQDKWIEWGPCPYGAKGDRLWVRETTYSPLTGQSHVMQMNEGMIYAADRSTRPAHYKTVPSIFMPRWASRITLEIVSVKVERLQDISPDDCASEGIETIPNALSIGNPHAVANAWARIDRFRQLWESINGPGSWDRNEWVWVIEFKKVAPLVVNSDRTDEMLDEIAEGRVFPDV